MDRGPRLWAKLATDWPVAMPETASLRLLAIAGLFIKRNRGLKRKLKLAGGVTLEGSAARSPVVCVDLKRQGYFHGKSHGDGVRHIACEISNFLQGGLWLPVGAPTPAGLKSGSDVYAGGRVHRRMTIMNKVNAKAFAILAIAVAAGLPAAAFGDVLCSGISIPARPLPPSILISLEHPRCRCWAGSPRRLPAAVARVIPCSRGRPLTTFPSQSTASRMVGGIRSLTPPITVDPPSASQCCSLNEQYGVGLLRPSIQHGWLNMGGGADFLRDRRGRF